jgi:hypothetical protein
VITASALPRLLNCPASAALPRAETVSVWADVGHEEHAELAAMTLAGDLPPRLAEFSPPLPRVEVKIAFDVATGTARILGDGVDDRKYGDLAPFEIAGSIDVLGVEDDAVVVLDWKTGQRDVEPAAINGQLRFYGLAAARALGLDRAILRIVYTQRGTCDEAEMDTLDLAGFAADLESLHGRVTMLRAQAARGGALDTREGSWCRHCASKPYCPSKSALLVQIGRGDIAPASLSPEVARSACERVLAAEQLVDDAKKRLNAYVTEHGPIDLGDGKMYGRYVRPGNERVRGDIALRAIREVCGELVEPFEAEAIETTTSKAAIKRAAKAVGDPSLERAVMGRIKALGGVSPAPDTMPIGEYPADKYDAAPIDYDAINDALKEAS